MGNPIPTQERSVDPFSSYNSDVVNKLTRIISDGNNTLLLPSPITVEKVDSTTVRALEGKALMDDVLIEIQNIDIDLADPDFYVDNTGGVWNEIGYYYLVLHYEYDKITPPPEAEVKVIKPSQRATVYNPNIHVFLGALEVSAPGGIHQLDAVYGYDPENLSVKRPTVGSGGGLGGLGIVEISGGGSQSVIPSTGTVIVDTTAGNTSLTLPDVQLVDHIIRIIKISSDSNTVTVTRFGSDTIEGSATVILTEQYDAVSLLPYASNDLWIEV